MFKSVIKGKTVMGYSLLCGDGSCAAGERASFPWGLPSSPECSHGAPTGLSFVSLSALQPGALAEPAQGHLLWSPPAGQAWPVPDRGWLWTGYPEPGHSPQRHSILKNEATGLMSSFTRRSAGTVAFIGPSDMPGCVACFLCLISACKVSLYR